MTDAMSRLVAHKMALDVIPSGGGFEDGVRFLLDRERVQGTLWAAKMWAEKAVQAVREARDPNPFKNADDETIATEILRQVEAKERARKRGT